MFIDVLQEIRRDITQKVGERGFFTEGSEGNKDCKAGLYPPFVIYRFLLFVFLLERNFVLACFWSICSGQNHSGDAAFEDRLMEVDPESFRG